MPTKAAQEGKKVVVIGTSFISMELVAAMSKQKLASIDIIGLEEFPFEAVLGKAVGAGLKKVLFFSVINASFVDQTPSVP
jgi:hypothetical protein